LYHVASTKCVQDALQQLKIIPKDVHPTIIDLTESPPPSPRVKHERRIDGVKHEDTTTDTRIKREPGEHNSIAQSPVLPKQTPARPASGDEPTIRVESATNERNRKRKAMENELKAVELEQKRIRLTQALAEM
jgi:hypothetical protein